MCLSLPGPAAPSSAPEDPGQRATWSSPFWTSGPSGVPFRRERRSSPSRNQWESLEPVPSAEPTTTRALKLFLPGPAALPGAPFRRPSPDDVDDGETPRLTRWHTQCIASSAGITSQGFFGELRESATPEQHPLTRSESEKGSEVSDLSSSALRDFAPTKFRL